MRIKGREQCGPIVSVVRFTGGRAPHVSSSASGSLYPATEWAPSSPPWTNSFSLAPCLLPVCASVFFFFFTVDFLRAKMGEHLANTQYG